MTPEYLAQKDFYSTSDLALATALSLSHPIETIDKQNPRKSQFLFQRDASLDKLIERYWNGGMQIEPKAYFNQLKILKARLYAED